MKNVDGVIQLSPTHKTMSNIPEPPNENQERSTEEGSRRDLPTYPSVLFDQETVNGMNWDYFDKYFEEDRRPFPYPIGPSVLFDKETIKELNLDTLFERK